MYESAAGGSVGGIVGAGTLPLTGWSIGWQIALALTLVVAGAALVRLAPRLGRRG